MNLLQDPRVQEYVASLNGTDFSRHEKCVCRCLQENPPKDVHFEFAQPFSRNLAEVAASDEICTIKAMVVYITKKSYFDGNTMKYLIDSMLKSIDIKYIRRCLNVLEINFAMHPPCAEYMRAEYEQLMLIPHKDFFEGKSIWDYLIGHLNHMISDDYLHGDKVMFNLAFKKVFCLCVNILNADFGASRKYNFRALVMKCLNIFPERRTNVSEITALLDKVFKAEYDINFPIIKLALLINKLKKLRWNN